MSISKPDKGTDKYSVYRVYSRSGNREWSKAGGRRKEGGGGLPTIFKGKGAFVLAFVSVLCVVVVVVVVLIVFVIVVVAVMVVVVVVFGNVTGCDSHLSSSISVPDRRVQAAFAPVIDSSRVDGSGKGR